MIVLMSLHQLADLMDVLATETWSKVDRAYRIRMSMSEVTISQHNLLSLEELNVMLAYQIRIEEVTQNAERRLGADFEIWLKCGDGRGLGFSIQAKRVRLGGRDYTYPELYHRGEKVPELQYDTLLRHAQKVNSVAMHLFYNGWDESDPTKPYFATSNSARPSSRLYGCAAIPTIKMKAIREAGQRMNNKVKAFEPFTFPWSDLLRASPSPPAGAAPGSAGSHPASSMSGSPLAPQAGPSYPTGSGAGAASSSSQFDAEVEALAEQMRPHTEDRASMLADKLPDYVEKTQRQGLNLPQDPRLPHYVLIIQAG